ncbi:hypothetical protein EDP2_868 [Enterobacter cloacae S611]|uniref:Uncharacterized protein n=1 Tax=Enterobacter cloacae S611 TaxID=1399146 RepID=A0ABN0Q5W9_ENTCL|nr:hypothetical protein EDP2_868 [Enterobacter cloacae S611]
MLSVKRTLLSNQNDNFFAHLPKNAKGAGKKKPLREGRGKAMSEP